MPLLFIAYAVRISKSKLSSPHPSLTTLFWRRIAITRFFTYCRGFCHTWAIVYFVHRFCKEHFFHYFGMIVIFFNPLNHFQKGLEYNFLTTDFANKAIKNWRNRYFSYYGVIIQITITLSSPYFQFGHFFLKLVI